MKSVSIKSSSSSNELQLSEQEGLLGPEGSEYYRVALTAKDLTASAKVYAFEPHGELAQYFADLATYWRGWNGEKKWSSLEGEFTLSCKSDDRGHVAMEVMLKSDSVRPWAHHPIIKGRLVNTRQVSEAWQNYVARVRQGQTITLHLTSPGERAGFRLTFPNGVLAEEAEENPGYTDWSSEVPASGDCQIEVSHGLEVRVTPYTLPVTVR